MMPSTPSSAFSCSTSASTSSSDVLGQTHVGRLDPDLLGGSVLEPDVDLGGGVVADEHRREAERAELRDLPGDLGAHPRGERPPVHERRGHGAEAIADADGAAALAAEERRGVDPRAPGGGPRPARRRRGSVERPRALDARAGVAHRRRRDPRLGRRPLAVELGDVRARRARGQRRRERSRDARTCSSRSRTRRAACPRRSSAARGPPPSRAASERTCSTTASLEHPASSASRARTRSRWPLARGPSSSRCASGSPTRDDASLSRHAQAARGQDARRRPDVPRPLALDDGRRRRCRT